MDHDMGEEGWPRVDGHAPWPRCEMDAGGWRTLAHALGRGEGDLVALFGDGDSVHMALRGPLVAPVGGLAVITRRVENVRPSRSVATA